MARRSCATSSKAIGVGGNLNYQVAGFSRYYELKFNPDPICDLIYNGVAARILHTGFVNGVQGDTSYRFDSRHTLRGILPEWRGD
ncbi:MAG: hypothetical protein WCA22_15915 [Candidatus Binatus sp.]